MDQYYDFDDARVRLDGWTDARNIKSRYRNQLRNFSKRIKTNGIKNICKPMAMTASQSWKLGAQEDGDVEPEEVVLRIQGIICNQDLPPIQRPFKIFTSSSEPHRRQYMRQSVMLTGLSSPKFDEAIASVYAIQGMFKQTSVNRSMEEWTPSLL
ncbi:hypothetical protein B0H34DRAFT_679814 [Crassisporium funariophilum]|nr:hypothetical protein B0H34DRAFT_679814 [Crassisporium funariophilum]